MSKHTELCYCTYCFNSFSFLKITAVNLCPVFEDFFSFEDEFLSNIPIYACGSSLWIKWWLHQTELVGFQFTVSQPFPGHYITLTLFPSYDPCPITCPPSLMGLPPSAQFSPGAPWRNLWAQVVPLAANWEMLPSNQPQGHPPARAQFCSSTWARKEEDKCFEKCQNPFKESSRCSWRVFFFLKPTDWALCWTSLLGELRVALSTHTVLGLYSESLLMCLRSFHPFSCRLLLFLGLILNYGCLHIY